jgi:hypothetical protein
MLGENARLTSGRLPQLALGPDVSFWGEAELDRAAEFATSVENDPSATSANHSTASA